VKGLFEASDLTIFFEELDWKVWFKSVTEQFDWKVW
jgi:hypothetical protein